jgi:hypothetical protein
VSAIEHGPQTPSTALSVTEPVRELFLEDLNALPREKRAEALARRFLLSYAGHTRAAYGRDLADWFGWCTALEIDPLAANRAMVDGYARHLETRRSPATIARRLSAIGGFYR